MQPVKNLFKPQIALLAITGIFLFILAIPHTMAVRLFTLALAGMLSFYLVRKRGMPKMPLKVPFALWLGLALVSLIFAVDPLYSLGEIKAEILYGLVAYFIFFSQAHSEIEYRWWISILLVSLTVISLTGIILWYSGDALVLPKYVYNGVGPYLTFLITLFPFILLWLLRTSLVRFPGNLLWLILPLILLLTYLTSNRMFWIASICSAATLFILLGLKEQDRRQKIRISVFFVSLLMIGIGFFHQALVNRVLKDKDETAVSVVDMTVNRDVRVGLWEFSIKQIVNHPWSGVGFGVRSFDYAYPKWAQENGFLFHGHNIFLNFGIQMGIPGILLLALLFFSILRQYWGFYQSADTRLQWLGACGLAMVIGVLLKNSTDHFFSRDLSLLFWSLVGMTLGYGKRLQE